MNVLDTIDISLDLETLATSTQSVVTEIGLAALINDEVNPTLRSVSTLHVFPDIDEQIRAGREIAGDTVTWRLMNPVKFETKPIQESLKQACTRIIGWLSSMEQRVLMLPERRRIRVWSKGPEFDLAILRSLMRDANCSLPIHYSSSRCVRTIEQLYPDEAKSVPRPANAHSALADAVYQLDVVTACLAGHESRRANPFVKTINSDTSNPADPIHYPDYSPEEDDGRWRNQEMDTVSIEHDNPPMTPLA